MLSGYVNCLTGFPTFCGNVVNRPWVYGSKGIEQLLETLEANGLPGPEYYADFTSNNFNCLQQLEPSMSCHAIDNYWLRTVNMATFFAEKIDSCVINSVVDHISEKNAFQLFPNPTRTKATIRFKNVQSSVEISIFDVLGEVRAKESYKNIRSLHLEVEQLPTGLYFIHLKMGNAKSMAKLKVY